MIGFGYDVHRLVDGIPFILGGVHINYSKGLLGHSDGDVLTHAIIDAILGASAQGDIGVWFPDSDNKYKGIRSIIMLENVISNLNFFEIVNIDTSVVIQTPKMQKYSNEIKKNISNACNINENRVNIKFKTEEFLGFTGNGDGVKAYAICELKRILR